MEENTFFLKYIFQEDIYIVDEPEISVNSESTRNKIDSETISKATVEEAAKPESYKNPTDSSRQVNINYFGHNKRGLLILVNEPSYDLINQADLDFLMKIVESGIKYSKNDFALVNAAKWPMDRILKEIPYKSLISFGVDNYALIKNDHEYRVVENNGKKELYVEDLTTISQDQSKKKKLWSALKKMFNI